MNQVFTTENGYPALVRGCVKVAWVNLGEGILGDYHPDDEDDINLLRFDIYTFSDGKWWVVDNASYCTRFPANSSKEQQEKALGIIMDRIYDPLTQDSEGSICKICEELSWIDPDSIKLI